MSTLLALKSITSSLGRQSSTTSHIHNARKSSFAFARMSNTPRNRIEQSSFSSTPSSVFYIGRHGSSSPLSNDRTRMFSSTSTSSMLTNNTHSQNFHQNSTSSSAFTTTTIAASTATAAAILSSDETTSTNCEDNEIIVSMPFPEEALWKDHYNGVTVDISKLPPSLTASPALFEEALAKALSIWKHEGKRGIWLKLKKENSNLIHSSIENGFDFQHAEKGKIILTKWLPNSESRLPLGPTHQIGIGALLIHPKDPTKMLVVQEKSGPAAAYKLWKMPTGLSDPGEDITDAAIREMKEETGLHCTFRKIVCFRQSHRVGSAAKSDLFFICLMSLDPKFYKDGEDVKLVPQEEEIASIDWMDIEEFSNQDHWVRSPLYNTLNNAMKDTVDEAKNKSLDDKAKKKDKGMIAKKSPVGIRPGEQTLYLSNL